MKCYIVMFFMLFISVSAIIITMYLIMSVSIQGLN